MLIALFIVGVASLLTGMFTATRRDAIARRRTAAAQRLLLEVRRRTEQQ